MINFQKTLQNTLLGNQFIYISSFNFKWRELNSPSALEMVVIDSDKYSKETIFLMNSERMKSMNRPNEHVARSMFLTKSFGNISIEAW